jgi:hypothetical protein
MPIAEAFGQSAPFAALLGHIQDGVQHGQIRKRHIPAPHRQSTLDFVEVRFRKINYSSIFAEIMALV